VQVELITLSGNKLYDADRMPMNVEVNVTYHTVPKGELVFARTTCFNIKNFWFLSTECIDELCMIFFLISSDYFFMHHLLTYLCDGNAFYYL
jgi:hypothetical protein